MSIVTNYSSISTLAPVPLRMGTRITNAFNGCFLFNLFDNAIADFLCVRTYFHGTSPKCYHNIMRIGADPSRGGTGGESGRNKALEIESKSADTEAYKKSGMNCKNRFFVFDHESQEFVKRWCPRMHAIIACIGENITPQQTKLGKVAFGIASFLEGFYAPILKFRVKSEDTIKFIHDETYQWSDKVAAYTQQPISPDHIGLYGTFKEGLNKDWFCRVKKNPTQFAKGIFQLVVSISLVALLVLTKPYNPTIAKALYIYSVVKGTQILARLCVPFCYKVGNSNQIFFRPRINSHKRQVCS